MKNRTLIILAGILTSIACCYLGWFAPEVPSSDSAAGTRDSIVSSNNFHDRLSIAFILGEDKEADNPYYDEAMRYYTNNPEGKTDFVVSACRSLAEVKDYLQENASTYGLPWGDVHLISHGNEWTGLSVKVAPDSKRATVQRIKDYIQSNAFQLLDENVIDEETTIFLHGCGVGNNPKLVDAVRTFFGSKKVKPMIFAPKLFEYYASLHSENNAETQRYLAQNWFVNFPMGEKPSVSTLTNELREKYISAKVDWQSALSREQPRWIGDTYYYTFEVPVKWVIPVDSLPDFTEVNQQNCWLRGQEEIMDELKMLQVPIEKFKWSFSNGYTETKQGAKTRAIFVKGYCTMLCVLQAMTEDQKDRSTLQKPFRPALTDTRFYYSQLQVSLAGI